LAKNRQERFFPRSSVVVPLDRNGREVRAAHNKPTSERRGRKIGHETLFFWSPMWFCRLL
jgi:hypothetical protein